MTTLSDLIHLREVALEHAGRLLADIADLDATSAVHLSVGNALHISHDPFEIRDVPSITLTCYSVDALREVARAVRAHTGTQTKDKTYGGDPSLVSDFHGTRVTIVDSTGRCEMVEVGTEVKSIPDPDAPLVEVEVPVYEKRCPESLLFAEEEPEEEPWTAEDHAIEQAERRRDAINAGEER